MITSGLKHYYKQCTITHISILHIHYHIIINITLPELIVYGTGVYKLLASLRLHYKAVVS